MLIFGDTSHKYKGWLITCLSDSWIRQCRNQYDIEPINCGLVHILWGCDRHGYGFVLTDYKLVSGAGTLASSAVTSTFLKMR